MRGKLRKRPTSIPRSRKPFNEARALCAGNWPSLQPAPPAARKPPMREVVANGPERTFPCARFGESIVLIV